MTTYMVSSVAGRLGVVLCGFAIVLPYVLRRNRLSGILGFAQEPAEPYLRRLWPHFWLGYLILFFSVVHGFTAAMSRANQAGVWAATVALFLLIVEVMLGLSLRDVHLARRTSIRRLHFWTMTAFVVSLASHLWLNAR